MSAEAAFFTRSWPVGTYSCTMTLQRPKAGAVVFCCVDWLPHQPKALSDADLATYRRGRNQALADMSRELGINAAVLEL